jgi:hypothetical protein
LNEEELRRLGGWIAPFRPDAGESLDSAWDRCPDARFLLGVAIEAGARPRGVASAIVGCLRALLPELWEEPPWRGALYVAEAYGRGEMEAEAVRQLVPPPRGGPKTADFITAAERALGHRATETLDGLGMRIALFALGSLHPETPARERTKAAAALVESLATAHAIEARIAAREAGREMLSQHRASGAAGVAVLVLPPIASSAWDEAAQRAYAQGIEKAASAVRLAIDKPWK